jgi:hypothetical protein
MKVLTSKEVLYVPARKHMCRLCCVQKDQDSSSGLAHRSRATFSAKPADACSSELLDRWLHEPAMKREFIEVYGQETYEQTERDAVALFPTYAKHGSRMLTNFFRLSEVI